MSGHGFGYAHRFDLTGCGSQSQTCVSVWSQPAKLPRLALTAKCVSYTGIQVTARARAAGASSPVAAVMAARAIQAFLMP